MKDYCGSEGSEWVPDIFPKSCEIHDRCYNTIGMKQEQCDGIFKTNMTNEFDVPLLPSVYFLAVAILGAVAYNKAQKMSKERKTNALQKQ